MSFDLTAHRQLQVLCFACLSITQLRVEYPHNVSVMELEDMLDLESSAIACGFDSHREHHRIKNAVVKEKQEKRA